MSLRHTMHRPPILSFPPIRGEGSLWRADPVIRRLGPLDDGGRLAGEAVEGQVCPSTRHVDGHASRARLKDEPRMRAAPAASLTRARLAGGTGEVRA